VDLAVAEAQHEGHHEAGDQEPGGVHRRTVPVRGAREQVGAGQRYNFGMPTAARGGRAGRFARGAAVGAALVVLGACGTASGDGATGPPATVRPSAVPRPSAPGRPGEVIAAVEADPPDSGRAWVVDYHSQGIDGTDVAERAVLAIPMTQPPAGGFPLIVW